MIFAEPAQRGQPRHECVLTSTRLREALQHRDSPAYRTHRNRERPGAIMGPGDRIALRFESEEVAVFNPVLLEELVRVGRARAEKNEKDPTALAIVIEGPFFERRPV